MGNIYFGSDRTLVDGHLLVPKSLSTSMLRSGRDPLRLFGDAQLSMAAMPVDNEEGSISVIDIDGENYSIQYLANSYSYLTFLHTPMLCGCI